MSPTLRKKTLKKFLREQDVSNINNQYIDYIGIEYPSGRTDTLTPETLEKLILSFHDLNDIDFDITCWYINEEKLVKDILKESNRIYKKYFGTQKKKKS